MIGRTRPPAPVSRAAVITLALGLLGALIVALIFVDSADAHPRQPARVVGYASWENLSGCYAPGRCRMACGRNLDDRAFTVAANPRHGLACGARIEICATKRLRHCVIARVADRTGSPFDFELTAALMRALGSRGAGWDAPRSVWWRRR